MAEYVSRLDDGDENKLRMLGNTTASGDGSSNGAFFRAVLSVRSKKVDVYCCVIVLVSLFVFTFMKTSVCFTV